MSVEPEVISPETPSEPNFADVMADASEGKPNTTPAPATVDTPQPGEQISETPQPADTSTPVTPPEKEEAPSQITETPIETKDAPPVTEAVAEPLVTEQPVKEVIVEKIIEKHPEIKDANAKALYDAIIGNDDKAAMNALVSYSREKSRDYTIMSEQEVVKADLAKKNPNWDRSDVETEIERQYGDLTKIDLTSIDRDLEPLEYKEAEAHNKRVEMGLKLLARDAKDARATLIDQQNSLELPKLENKAPEQPQSEQPSAEAIAAANREWEQKVDEGTKDFAAISVRIGDRQVAYNLTDGDKTNTVSAVKEFNLQNFVKDQGWVGEDGATNTKKMAEDIFKLKNFEKIVNAYASQAENKGRLNAIGDIKNITPPSNTPAPTQATSFDGAFYEAMERASNN